LGGIISNMTRLIPIAAQHDELMPQAIPSINGLANGYPNLTQWLNENLKESKATKFWKGSKQCTLANIIFIGDQLGSYFKRGIDSFLSDPVPAFVFKHAGVVGQTGTPKIPWYLYMVINPNTWALYQNADSGILQRIITTT
jgi:secretory lipase